MFSPLAAAALAAASPSAFEDLDALDARLKAIANVQAIDKRLKLPRCPVPARISPAGPRAFSISCPDLGWRLFAPQSPMAALQDEALAVGRGDVVNLELTGPGFSILTAATALEDGRKHAVIRLKIEGKTAPIQAVVENSGLVRLNMDDQP